MTERVRLALFALALAAAVAIGATAGSVLGPVDTGRETPAVHHGWGHGHD
jgi:hypothetical protein